MREVKLENYTLRSVKMNPKTRTCEVAYIAVFNDNGGVISHDRKDKPNYMACDALVNRINDLKEALCKVHSKQKDKYPRVTVTGFTISGKAGEEKYEISGIDKSASDQNMPIKTHKISYSDETYGFETEISDIADDLKVLTYNYIIKEEQAQTSAFSDKETEEETEEE